MRSEVGKKRARDRVESTALEIIIFRRFEDLTIRRRGSPLAAVGDTLIWRMFRDEILEETTKMHVRNRDETQPHRQNQEKSQLSPLRRENPRKSRRTIGTPIIEPIAVYRVGGISKDEMRSNKQRGETSLPNNNDTGLTKKNPDKGGKDMQI